MEEDMINVGSPLRLLSLFLFNGNLAYFAFTSLFYSSDARPPRYTMPGISFVLLAFV